MGLSRSALFVGRGDERPDGKLSECHNSEERLFGKKLGRSNAWEQDDGAYVEDPAFVPNARDHSEESSVRSR